MPAPIGSLFQLTPRDSESALWSPFYLSLLAQGIASPIVFFGDGQVVGAAAIAPVSTVIPAGYLFWVHSLTVQTIPGTGQRSQSITVTVVNQLGNIIGMLGTIGPGNANTPVNESIHLNIEPGIALLSGVHFLRVAGRFDTGANVNLLDLGANGFITVRGNASL